MGRVREVNVGVDVVLDGSNAVSIRDTIDDYDVVVVDVHASAEELVVVPALLDVQCDLLSDVHARGDLPVVIGEEDLAGGGTVEIAVGGTRSREHFGHGGVAGGGVEGALEEGGEGEVNGAGVEGQRVDEGLGLRECLVEEGRRVLKKGIGGYAGLSGRLQMVTQRIEESLPTLIQRERHWRLLSVRLGFEPRRIS